MTNSQDDDCYFRALPSEPRFTLLARDPEFFSHVTRWAEQREIMIRCGERPDTDMVRVSEARMIATRGLEWRRNNLGLWRRG